LGAAGNPVLAGENDRTSIDFERVFDPATEPPAERMVIRTDADDFVTVDAE
jgi:hypothetical protein